ncbi:ABC transporter ATP-binding protein [bacterium]|nr:ABC transporter ATP-binding protein [bacterium]
MISESPVLYIEDLKTHFFTRDGVVKAVDGVNLSLTPGKIIGLVGESGSGKSVTGFSILGLVDHPGCIVNGIIRFKESDLRTFSEKELRHLRGNGISMIFQDPMMTLNPVLRIDLQMTEAIRTHDKSVDRKTALARCVDALKQVGISEPEKRLKAYPHQFSGGMRQRVAIAIALLNKPDVIIADEPTTALDVTIQSQILCQVQKLCRENNTAMIWITHDLAVVAGLADRIHVMYAGRIVEEGETSDIIDNPLHPYTAGLINSVPGNTHRGKPLKQIPGMTPSLLNLPGGCAFRLRCSRADSKCENSPPVKEPAPGHKVHCFNPYLKS